MSIIGDLLKGAGDFMNESFYLTKIANWVRSPINDTAKSISEFIYVTPDDVVKEMDRRFLDYCVICINMDERKRAVKRYVIFKLEETEKHKRFIGFPKENDGNS